MHESSRIYPKRFADNTPQNNLLSLPRFFSNSASHVTAVNCASVSVDIFQHHHPHRYLESVWMNRLDGENGLLGLVIRGFPSLSTVLSTLLRLYLRSSPKGYNLLYYSPFLVVGLLAPYAVIHISTTLLEL